jgi:hypothetical protein
VWTAKSLPWPHFFAAPAGLGGVDSGSAMALLVTCGATGQAVRGAVIGAGGRKCLRLRLVAIGPWDPGRDQNAGQPWRSRIVGRHRSGA